MGRPVDTKVFPHKVHTVNKFIKLLSLLPGIRGGVDADLQPLDLLLARLQPAALPAGVLLSPGRACDWLPGLKFVKFVSKYYYDEAKSVAGNHWL